MVRPSTLYDVLAGSPAALALIVASGGPKITRGELHQAIIQTAASLQAAGIKPGDTVSIAMANTVDYIIAFLAATYARAVAAPLNAAYKVDEFAFYLEDSRSRLLLVPQEGNKAGLAAAQQLGVPVASLSVSYGPGSPPQVSITPVAGGLVFRAPSSFGGAALPGGAPLASDVGLFLHTSGTTSKPKGVPLSHGNLAASLANIAATYELTPADRSYLVMPLFHVHGLMAGLLAPLASGSSVILPKEGRFAAHSFWKDCVEHQATFYTAVPTMHQILLARATQDYPARNPPPLRFIRSCSSSLAPATLEKLEATFKVPVLEAYAMTEASHQMTSNPLPKYGPRKAGSVGKAQGSVQVAILDDKNVVLPTGQIGEVCIRGPNVTKGYLNNPKANEEAYAGGWFHTGDQGWLDEAGYLTLTGRLKELINRGGEKISPLEVDAVLLSHPAVAEAVCFGAPDTKYGEVVAAAVVLKPGAAKPGLEKDIQKHCLTKLAGFKVPSQIFFTEVLPKTATGKIQRRHMVTAFCKPGSGSGAGGGGPAPAAAPTAPQPEEAHAHAPGAGLADGAALAAQALAALGVKHMFGVVGIPVTTLASAAQAEGIRFVGCRNEQAAGYAAAAAGYLTGTPSVLLTVSGPGAVHGIAGLSHASVNCWPLIMVSGSAVQSELGKGSFQECDQVAAVKQFCKYATKVRSAAEIPAAMAAAYHAAINGRPGASYVDLPSDVLMGSAQGVKVDIPAGIRLRPAAAPQAVAQAAALLRGAQRPLLLVGKGAAMAGAEGAVQELVNRFGLPLLGTAMGRGLVPDSHPLAVHSARALALRKADVAVVVGARLNWQLHFGEAPRWAQDVKFVLVDIEPSPRDAGLAAVVLRGDAGEALRQLGQELGAGAWDAGRIAPWVAELTAKAAAASQGLARKLAAPPPPALDYYSTLGALRGCLEGVVAEGRPAPCVVSEGANTMDMARLILPVWTPRSRLDAGTWGTMGVGLGYALAAAAARPDRLVVAVEGDSAFGFSGMEVETMVRYKLPIVVVVMNNGGVYGGDRRAQDLVEAAHRGAAKGGFTQDPAPTSFVEGSRYDVMMSAFHGAHYNVASVPALQAACAQAFREMRPALINVVLDPMAGVESGNVHAFNAPKSKI